MKYVEGIKWRDLFNRFVTTTKKMYKSCISLKFIKANYTLLFNIVSGRLSLDNSGSLLDMFSTHVKIIKNSM